MLTARSLARRGVRQLGFTLTELMVTVAVLSVGAMLVAPGAGQMMANRRIQVAAQNILDGLNQARAEAVRRNVPVRFSLNTGGNGWSLVQASSGDTLQSFTTTDWSSLVITPAGAATTVTFLPNGLRQTGAQLSQVTVSSPMDGSAVRRINVFGGGLIRMCDPAITTADDPRRC